MMNYEKAIDVYMKQYLFGKPDNTKCVFPYNLHYVDDVFIESTINIDIIKYNTPNEDKVIRYINMLESGINMNNVWVSYGKKMKNGVVQPYWHNTFTIMDGTHRTEAKKRIGRKLCDVIMPLSHYNLYNEVIK